MEERTIGLELARSSLLRYGNSTSRRARQVKASLVLYEFQRHGLPVFGASTYHRRLAAINGKIGG